ncbi:hypothetical protein BDR07DRAFT_1431584 [Suillus spraguei]|nr:hypothetical protein BDR07DRAFT_1431584 [Suillus spraguei]
MSATLLGAVGSMGVPYRFGQIRMQSDVTLLSIVGVKLGVPDMLMEYKDPDGDCIPLWATEVSVSQTKKSATKRLSDYMTDREDLLAVSLVDVKEVKKHAGPQLGSEATQTLEDRSSVSTFAEWLSCRVTDTDPIVMKAFGHTWQHPITATVSTWLRRPDGSFNMNDEDSDFHAIASLFPARDGLEDVEHVFRRTLERVRDYVISLIKTRSPRDVDSSAFNPIRRWSPPASLINWDVLADEIIVGAKQTGYGRYATWHDRILKRKAEENEVTTGGSGSTKRTRTI